MTSPSTLISLAILKVNADSSKNDYIHSLIPFVSYVILDIRPDPVTTDVVQDGLRDQFGLNIPQQVIELMLRRIAKHGGLVLSHYLYHFTSKLKAPNIVAGKQAATMQLNRVTSELIAFVHTKFNLSWSVDDAVAASLNYLNEFSIECLRTYALRSALPNLPHRSSRELYAVHSFVYYLYTERKALFEDLMVFVKGHMLANVLICSDLANVRRKLGHVTFYFDTPLMLRLLGLLDVTSQVAAEELVRLLKILNASVSIFEHTYDELYRVIYFLEVSVENLNVRTPSLAAIRAAGTSASDILLIREQLKMMCGRAGVTIRRNPEYDPQYQIDEAALQGTLDDDVRYGNPRAVVYDVNSIRSIYALRKGTRPRSLEECGAVLVTTNAALAKVAFALGHKFKPSREVSTVITDFSLANIAWLKIPLEAPDLPRVEVIAACYAAMEPGQALWDKYLAELEKLEQRKSLSVEELAILRSSTPAVTELMHLTMGSETAFTPRTIAEILDRVRNDLVRRERAATAQERRKREDAEFRHFVLEEREERRRRRMERIASGIGAIVVIIVLFGLVVIIGGGSVMAVFSKQRVDSSGVSGRASWKVYSVSTLIWLGFVWGVFNWWFGLSFWDVAKKFGRCAEISVKWLLSTVSGG